MLNQVLVEKKILFFKAPFTRVRNLQSPFKYQASPYLWMVCKSRVHPSWKKFKVHINTYHDQLYIWLVSNICHVISSNFSHIWTGWYILLQMIDRFLNLQQNENKIHWKVNMQAFIHSGARYTRAQIQIDEDPNLPSQDHQYCVYMVNRRSRFASVLRVAFEDANANAVRPLPRIQAWRYSHESFTCAYLHLRTICCFQIYSTSSYLRSVENFRQIQIDLDLASPLTIRIDLDPRSRVASPTVDLTDCSSMPLSNASICWKRKHIWLVLW